MATKLSKKDKELMATEAAKNARGALICSIVGIFLLGIIFEPIALYFGLKAKNTLDNIESFDSSSRTQAILACIISSIVMGVSIIAVLAAL